MADGTKLTVPYSANSIAYKATSRCNVVKGCCKDASGNVVPFTDSCPPGTTFRTLDTIGVRIAYRHKWVTPAGSVVGSGNLDLVQSNTMRMEPVL